MSIKITAGHNGKTIEIIADENSTIKELKKLYVAACAAEEAKQCFRNKVVIPEYTEKEKAVLDKAVLEAEYNFKFVLGTQILDNDKTLKDALLKGEVTINAFNRSQVIADCLKDINELDPTLSPIDMLDKLKTILSKKINKEGENPISANSDKDIVLAAVKKCGLALQFASEELKADKAIVLAAVKQNGRALQFASPELKVDKEFMLAVVQKNGAALQCVSTELTNYRNIVLAAVQQIGDALQNASIELKNDRAIVLAAVKKNGYSIQYASPKLKDDTEIVAAAVKQNGLALMYAPKELKGNTDFMIAAVQQNGAALKYAPEELKANTDFMLAAVQQNGEALEHELPEFKSNNQNKRSTSLRALMGNSQPKDKANTASSSSNNNDLRKPLLPKGTSGAHRI